MLSTCSHLGTGEPGFALGIVAEPIGQSPNLHHAQTHNQKRVQGLITTAKRPLIASCVVRASSTGVPLSQVPGTSLLLPPWPCAPGQAAHPQACTLRCKQRS